MTSQPPEPDRGSPPSQEDYENLRRQAEALRQSPQVRRERELESRSRDRGEMSKYLRYTGLGLQFAATLGLPMAGGYALDLWLGLLTKFPVFLLTGALLGISAAMYGVIRAVSRMEGEDSRKDESKGRKA